MLLPLHQPGHLETEKVAENENTSKKEKKKMQSEAINTTTSLVSIYQRE